MSEQTPAKDHTADQDKLADMIADSDTGGRKPTGIPMKILWAVPLAWALFQLWYASPLPFIFNIGLFNSTEARSIHLAFAVFLAFTAFPTFKSSPRDYIPIQDWIVALVGAFAAGYIFLFYDELALRPGLPTQTDIIVAIVGLVLVLEATRRALGPPLTIVALVFMAYTFLGDKAPDMISYQGASLQKAMSHYYLTTEGMFGVALGVSTSLVFLFVLFGSLLEKAGAGNYFIRVAFALMGHMRGGPAKAAVVSSGLTGLVSGSAIANVVTTGTFTIPLMKKVGFPSEKAGAVEVASSTNGQLTPPVMGAVAFLMVEFVGISYPEVIKHAILPAMISYMALVYIVHLEAVKADMKGLPRKHVPTFVQNLIGFGGTFLGLAVLCAVMYYGFSWVKTAFGDATIYVAVAVLVTSYVGLVAYAAKFPELPDTIEVDELPEPGPTIKAGLYYLVPVFLLVWCLIVERLSPSLSAFYATLMMLFILITQDAVKSVIKGSGGDMAAMFVKGCVDALNGMVSGARNMIGIGVATAAAGLIIGTMTLTGVGAILSEVIEFLSGGQILIMLILTAIFSLILGMGLPTTANYIVVSALMAPVIVTVGAENGLIVPLIAVHMFVFYFGILADDTPPVAMAAFAAAAISGGDPIRTGIQGFLYDIRTAILPFLFIFNTELLLIGIESWVHLLVTIVTAVIAMLLFAAATQGYFFARCKWYEVVALLLVAFTLFRPGFWMDRIEPPLVSAPAQQIYDAAAELPDSGQLRVRIKGETLEGDQVDKTVMLNMGDVADGETRVRSTGLELREDEGRLIVDNVEFGSQAEAQEIDFDYEIVSVELDNPDQLPKQLFYIPALILLALIIMVQRRRRDREAATQSATA